MKKIAVIASFITLLSWGFAFCGSLAGGSNTLYSNKNNYKKGDIIKIYISESSTAIQGSQTNVSKDSGLTGALGITGLGALPSGNGALSFGESSKGGGTSTQSGSFEASISAEVMEVKENGIITIKGKKEIELNGSSQKLLIEGEVNPADISADNVVLSSAVSNMKVTYSGDGAVGTKARVGIITQILDWLWIF